MMENFILRFLYSRKPRKKDQRFQKYIFWVFSKSKYIKKKFWGKKNSKIHKHKVCQEYSFILKES